MLEIGDTVKINFKVESMLVLDKDVLADIKKWNKQHNGIHKITNICSSGLWTNKEVKKYELDSDYMFFLDEINKIE